MWKTVLTVSLIACPALTPALADVKGPGGKTIDCYCTDSSGSRVELGDFICLQVDGRMFTAQCQMSLNNPMWREVQQGCVSSSLRPGTRMPSQLWPKLLQPVIDAGRVHTQI